MAGQRPGPPPSSGHPRSQCPTSLGVSLSFTPRAGIRRLISSAADNTDASYAGQFNDTFPCWSGHERIGVRRREMRDVGYLWDVVEVKAKRLTFDVLYGLKSSWSEGDKPPISKVQKVGPKKHALIQPNPLQMPKENPALLRPRSSTGSHTRHLSEPAISLVGPQTSQWPQHLDLNKQVRPGLA